MNKIEMKSQLNYLKSEHSKVWARIQAELKGLEKIDKGLKKLIKQANKAGLK